MAKDNIIKRIGNTITVNISVIDGAGKAVNLDSRFGIQGANKHAKFEIFIIKAFGRTYNVPESSVVITNITSGKLSFDWKASNQYGVGRYTILLRLYKTKANSGSTVTYETPELESSIDLTEAISLTQHTCQGTDISNSVDITFELEEVKTA